VLVAGRLDDDAAARAAVALLTLDASGRERSATDGGHQGALVLQGKLRHGRHPILPWCTAHVTVEQDSNENLKPSKKKSHERIDGISALVNALTVDRSTTSARRCSWIYEQRFPTATGVPGAHPVAKRGSASLQSTFSGGRP
jgi:Phage Terminase